MIEIILNFVIFAIAAMLIFAIVTSDDNHPM